MSAPVERYNVTAGRPYTTRDGEEKRQWINVGRATKWDDGNISLEFHAIPVGAWWDGKLSLFAEDKDKAASKSERPQRSASVSDQSDDVPF
ncbi:hypothetical protein [Pseudoxanthomonas sp. CF125]|uniref:hypothetical protein n=1 Tax=Pseudoxanthomonas sp. CF125 TaxID=1855303 RepID=UPI00089249B6|nr:hypothetical protein [Pseudoxanthomonas sp. CF125]SDQ43337.1 hypothetical protein SAMN05216569_1106 [Pseudoxanthomonas sp. CF125]